jgi:nucleoid DNA-binding protein/LysM repeat protein
VEDRLMSKITDLASLLAEKHGISHKEAEMFVSLLFDIAKDALHAQKQVKIKGLGTFKLTSVSSRESIDVNTGQRILIEGRDKVSFTPDAAMKNLVNRPFAQFETVILKDDVDFTDIDKKYDEKVEEEALPTEESVQEEAAVQEAPIAEEPVVEEPVVEEATQEETIVEEPVVEEPVQQEETIVEEPVVEEPVVEEPVQEETIVEEPPVTPMQAAFVDVENNTQEDNVINEESEDYEDEMERKRSEELAKKLSRSNSIIIGLAVALVLLLAYGLYSINNLNKKMDDRDSKINQLTEEVTKSKKNEQIAKDELTKQIMLFNNDERVRRGNLKIVGIEKTVTAVAGQTLKSISRDNLGPNMEMYLEAVNPGVRMVLIGQEIQIPKLEPKNAD